MSNDNDEIGGRGEELVSAIFKARVPVAGNAILFSSRKLDAKNETTDLIVRLRDKTSGKATGMFFFVQIKTTEKPGSDPKRVKTKFKPADVATVHQSTIPTYLVVVDLSKNNTEKIYIMGIDSSRKKGVARVNRRNSLKKLNNLDAVYEEVKSHFLAKTYSFSSKFK